MNTKLRVILPFLIIAAGLAGAVIMVKSRPGVKPEEVTFSPPVVRVRDVFFQDVRMEVRSQGTVVPRTQSNLVSQVSGEIIEISDSFAAGGFFDAGEMLVRIDPRDYEYAIKRLDAEIAQAKVMLAREEEEAALARLEWERVGKGRKPSPLVLREPQLEEARAVLRATQASLDQARLNLKRTIVSAPFSGRIRDKNANIGQYVTTGQSLGTIYAVDFAEIRLPVADAELAYLDICLDAQTKTLTCPVLDVVLSADFAGSTYQWRGSIVRVEGAIDPKTRMVHLVCSVSDPYGRKTRVERPPLAVGMYVQAVVMGLLVQDAVVLDRSVLRGQDRVLVVDDQNRLHYRNVAILRKDARKAVISSGLQPGERVIISPLAVVVEGMEVRVLDETGAGKSARGDGATQ